MNETHKIEQIFDGCIESLKIFNLSRNQAIIYLLRIVDDYARIPLLTERVDAVEMGHFNVRRAMDALSFLMPLIDEKNRKSRKFNLSRYRENNYQSAGEAMEIGEIYAEIEDLLRLAGLGIYKIKRRGKNYYFFTSRELVRKDANSQVVNLKEPLKMLEDVLTQSNPRELKALIDSYTANGLSLEGMVSMQRDGSMTYSIPSDLLNTFKKLFGVALSKVWTLDETIKFGKYSISDARKIWLLLDAVAGFQQMLTLQSNLPGIGMEYLPISVKKNYLIQYISNTENIRRDAVKQFIDDLTFNKKVMTNEIMFQPFLESDDGDCLFFSPAIILLSNPERNMMKLWSRAYGGIYGSKIAKKGLLEESKVAQALRDSLENANVVNGKKLTISGKQVTDVDVGVLDRNSKTVLFIQHKWIIQPDSTKEVQNSDEKLNEAISQIDKIFYYLKQDPQWVRNIFQENAEVEQILAFVLSTSNTGSYWASNKYKTFNQQIFLRTVKDRKYKTVSDIYKFLIKNHTFKSYIDYFNIYNGYEYAGYRFYAPGTALVEKKDWSGLAKHLIFGVLFKDNDFFWKTQTEMKIFNQRSS